MRSRHVTKIRAWAFAILGMAVLASCSGSEAQPPAAAEGVNGCTAEAKGEAGQRFFALLVGVGRYKSPSIKTLHGPPNDVAAMRELLVGRYGFPAANVCTLLDDEATTAAFKDTFDRALVKRAAANDVAVLYFSGHGSQAADVNGDDSGDGYDETIMLHDTWTEGVRDLIDDELNAMLEGLHARTRNVVVILDSCNSGSATRDPADSAVIVKAMPPKDRSTSVTAGSMGGSSDRWVPDGLPGAVVLTAAADGTSALEIGGRGVFTEALVQALGRPGKDPLTYAQLARQLPPIVQGLRSHQIPYFQGNLDRDAFGVTSRPRPMAWEVRRAGSMVEITGPPTPGLDTGAELRVYAPALPVADYGDPAKAKATLVVDESTGLNAKAHVIAAASGAAALEAGDLAILVRPSDASIRVSVRLRPEAQPGGIPAPRAADLKKRIHEDPDAGPAVEVTDGTAELELSRSADGQILVRDHDNIVRNSIPKDTNVALILSDHARQKALLHLHGEGGSDFTDEQTLQVQLVPAKEQTDCGAARLEGWVQGPPNDRQIMPLCVNWNVKVSLDPRAMKPVLIGGVVISSDGSSFGFPEGDKKIQLLPGKSWTFDETFTAGLPLDSTDVVRVFGTQESNPVPWSRVTQGTLARSASPGEAEASPLFRALDRYFMPGARGQQPNRGPVEDTTWTVSTVQVVVEANAGFEKPKGLVEGLPHLKEYTLSKFDIRPYLPDDRASALHAVLAQADALARRQVGYKQHDWVGNDDADLQKGIDCSRAIWYAFTRAGLKYNQRNEYLATAGMVGNASLMKEQFDRIDKESGLRLGDVLVYRDDQRGDGHVVMVIDPKRRIAWGSHGWDGNARELPIEPQTGVEYQLIKYKPDWDRWDRKTMDLKAVWRYRQFSKEADSGRGLPGTLALEGPCEPGRCRPASPAPAGPVGS
ncbi:MAG: caspase family protein [Candidatus Polarisedimenticolia bacterium]